MLMSTPEPHAGGLETNEAEIGCYSGAYTGEPDHFNRPLSRTDR